MLISHKIDHINAYGLHKASYCNRLNRKLEKRLYEYFYENQTFKYTDILNDIVKSYNNTQHSAIHMAPAKVNENNSESVYECVYILILKENAAIYAYEIGDLVRLSHQNTPFRRGYNESLTEELFRVCNKIPSFNSYVPASEIKQYKGKQKSCYRLGFQWHRHCVMSPNSPAT